VAWAVTTEAVSFIPMDMVREKTAVFSRMLGMRKRFIGVVSDEK
jgi:hypothetical protein